MPVLRTAFRSLARLRSAPAFHPKGLLYDGVLAIDGPGPLPDGSSPALVRLSKGIGTPTGVPDFLGLAVRLERPDGQVDVLVTSSAGRRSWRRFVLTPARSWGSVQLSSLMVLESGAEHVTVGFAFSDPRLDSPDPDAVAQALPVEAAVTVVDSQEVVVQTGRLTLHTVSARGEEETAFDPDLNAPPGWRLGPGWLARIRETAYVGSRRGRAVRDDSVR